MLPIILGTIALGTVGYKCIKEGSIKDGVTASLEDTLEAVCNGLDAIDKKFNLNMFEDTLEESTSIKRATLNSKKIKKRFVKLYKFKLKISKEINSLELISLGKISIVKDKTKNVAFTEEMAKNVESYNYLLKSAFKKFIELKDEERIISNPYFIVLKELCSTKIIKKSKLTEESIVVINKSNSIITNNN